MVAEAACHQAAVNAWSAEHLLGASGEHVERAHEATGSQQLLAGLLSSMSANLNGHTAAGELPWEAPSLVTTTTQPHNHHHH